MKKINSLFESIFSPVIPHIHYLLRFILGISFFLHGFGKLPISQGFIGWLGSQGVIYPELIAYFVAWGEILSGIGIIFGGLLIQVFPAFSNFLTRVSGGIITIIMVSALIVAHSDWNIFFGERGKILFASEQLFLLTLGTYFLVVGNNLNNE